LEEAMTNIKKLIFKATSVSFGKNRT